MNFAVERAPEGETQPSTQPSTAPPVPPQGGTQSGTQSETQSEKQSETQSGAQTEEEMRGTNARTGDPTDALPWMLAAMASGLVAWALWTSGRRRKGGQGHE